MFFSATAALFAASFLQAAFAHNIQLPAHGRECFHEELHKDDTMTVTFQTGDREFGGAGNLDIDFWVWQLFAKRKHANANMFGLPTASSQNIGHESHGPIRDLPEGRIER